MADRNLHEQVEVAKSELKISVPYDREAWSSVRLHRARLLYWVFPAFTLVIPFSIFYFLGAGSRSDFLLFPFLAFPAAIVPVYVFSVWLADYKYGDMDASNCKLALELCEKYPELDEFKKTVIALGRPLVEFEFLDMKDWPQRKEAIIQNRKNAEACRLFYSN